MAQFNKVNCQHGAPMGRRSYGTAPDAPRSVYLFRVQLDSGGYDDGGAYWGHSRESVYCARDKDGEYFATTCAVSRRHAMQNLEIEPAALAAPLKLSAVERSQKELARAYLAHLNQ